MIGMSRPLGIWLASVAGMAIGLSIDCRSVSPAALASLCASGGGLSTLIRHLALLPATNIGMALGMLAALALATPLGGGALCRGVACYALMLAGMSLGGCAGVVLCQQADIVWAAPLMLAAMTLGMTAGMMVAEPLSRFRERDQTALRYRRWRAAGSR
jgi:hypothetical protein